MGISKFLAQRLNRARLSSAKLPVKSMFSGPIAYAKYSKLAHAQDPKKEFAKSGDGS